MIKVLELFAGIGACSKALENLGIEHEIVDAVEIDKYAIKSFNAIHGTNFEPQDITKWDKDIECDLIIHGSPCQDFSIAGLQAGGDAGTGTRSSLMYESLRIIEKLKPKYVIWENVKNLLSKKHRHNFDAYQEAMEKLGYKNYYQVLNAKNYGVPQNRERVFTVSILGGGDFTFPEPIPLEKKLKDILEPTVDEKYYLSDSNIKCYQRQFGSKGKEIKEDIVSTLTSSMGTGGGNVPYFTSITKGETFGTLNGGKLGKMHDISRRAYHTDGVAPAMHTCGGRNTEPKIVEPFIVASRGRGENNEQHLEPRYDGTSNTITSVQKDNYVAIKTANSKGYDLATDGDGIDLAYPDSKTRRGRVGHGAAKTLPASDSQGVIDGVRIRKLTPTECWKLMGFTKEDCEKASKAGISNSQLYKQAGNSIVVDVLMAIFSNLIKGNS